jgi:hypothetical protein
MELVLIYFYVFEKLISLTNQEIFMSKKLLKWNILLIWDNSAKIKY